MTPGPVPARSEERRRRNGPPVEKMTVVEGGFTQPVTVPPANPEWHELARDWYESLAISGQAKFYEPSDWMIARINAEVLTRALAAPRLNAQIFAAFHSVASDLLSTEASRRRLRMEIDRVRREPAAPVEDAAPKRQSSKDRLGVRRSDA